MEEIAERMRAAGFRPLGSCGVAWVTTAVTLHPVGSSGRTGARVWEVVARFGRDGDYQPQRRFGVMVRPYGDLGEYSRQRFTPCAADVPTLAAAAVRDPYGF